MELGGEISCQDFNRSIVGPLVARARLRNLGQTRQGIRENIQVFLRHRCSVTFCYSSYIPNTFPFTMSAAQLLNPKAESRVSFFLFDMFELYKHANSFIEARRSSSSQYLCGRGLAAGAQLCFSFQKASRLIHARC